MTCTHGIIYGVKFLLRFESPRDYIDMVRSMKHRPNILICDMAHMVAAQGNRFQANFICPFESHVAESTVENIEMAKSGQLSVSFPFLEDNAPVELQNANSNCHPVTGSNVRLSLFDIFHQGNTKNDTEALCRIGCIKELRGIINSQAAEQLHCFFNKDKHFLNQMTPVNHIFMFCSVIELRNKANNLKTIEKLRAQTNSGFFSDPFGRSYLYTFDQQPNNSQNPLHITNIVYHDCNSMDVESKVSPSHFSDEEDNCDNDAKSEVNSISSPVCSPTKQ